MGIKGNRIRPKGGSFVGVTWLVDSRLLFRLGGTLVVALNVPTLDIARVVDVIYAQNYLHKLKLHASFLREQG